MTMAVVAAADSSQGITGEMEFIGEFFCFNTEAARRAKHILFDLLLNDGSYFSKNILCVNFKAVVAHYMDMFADGGYISRWSFAFFIIDLHDRVAKDVEQDTDVAVSLRYIPSRYITILDCAVPGHVMDTEYDIERFESDDMTTIAGSDRSYASSLN